jgi:hypothetical protein
MGFEGIPSEHLPRLPGIKTGSPRPDFRMIRPGEPRLT